MRYHILVAEDERMTRQMIVENLKHILPESQITTADNGVQAVRLSDQAAALEMVFLDIRMPLLDGIQAAKSIRKRWKNCQIIFLTAYSDYEYMHEAISLQAADYLLKPFSQTGMAVAVHKAVERLEQLQAGNVSFTQTDTDMTGVPRWARRINRGDFATGICAVIKCPSPINCSKVLGMLRGCDWKSYQEVFFDHTEGKISLILVSPAEENLIIQLNYQLREVAKKMERFTGERFYCGIGQNLYAPSGIEESLKKCEEDMQPFYVDPAPEIKEKRQKVKNTESDEKEKQRIEAYLMEHFSSELSLEQVALDMGYSRTYFSKRFKQLFKENFITYLIGMRIMWAKELLSQDKTEIHSVSRQCGFQDAAYFTSVFRRITGETPTKYRERVTRGE